MRAERWALRAAESLVRLASRRLPPHAREDRYREWAAELPVILHDPEVRPTVRRVVRMFWFAADTLRGAARGASPPRHREAHRVGAGKPNGWPLLLMFPFLGSLISQFLPGASLESSALFWLGSLAVLVWLLARRRAGESVTLWYGIGLLALATGQLVRVLAPKLGWGHPMLFMVVDLCGDGILVVCYGMTIAVWVRSRRRARVSG